jgi:hypothetical protein
MSQAKYFHQEFQARPNLNSLALLPVLGFGLEDGINLCGWATVLTLFYTITRWANSLRQIYSLGFSFIFGCFLTKILIILGSFDPQLNEPQTIIVIRASYLVLAVLFIACGVRYFIDWRNYRFVSVDSKFLIPLPVFLSSNGNPKDVLGSRRFLRVFLGLIKSFSFFIFGFAFAFLEAAFMHDYHMFLRVLHFAARGQVSVAIMNILLYLLGALLPLLILWMSMVWLMKRRVSNPPSVKFISLYKIVCSALYLSVGAGLIIQFIQ